MSTVNVNQQLLTAAAGMFLIEWVVDSDPNNDAEHGGRIAGYDTWEFGKRLEPAEPRIRLGDGASLRLEGLRITHLVFQVSKC